MAPEAPAWEALRPADLPAVMRLAALAHPALPERQEVFAEKLALFAAGCLKLSAGGGLIGYGFSHPWHTGAVPKLDSFLGALPARDNCLYIHDVAVAPAARGAGAAEKYVKGMSGLAARLNLPSLALTAVYGTGKLWRRFGFGPGQAPEGELAAYGAGAEYLVKIL